MKVIRTLVVLDRGKIIDSAEWEKIHLAYTDAIRAMVHPPGSKQFTIRKKTRKLNAHGKPTNQWNRNGVTAIRQQFFDEMLDRHWKPEDPLDISSLMETYKASKEAEELFLEYPSKQAITEPLHNMVGDFDHSFRIADKWRAVIEWETGNISSSHRSMNKLCLALMASQIEVGVLIVPSRELYPHLTDRIGNWMELSPYLHFWKRAGKFVEKGLLAVTVVEHDELTDDPKVPYIAQGKDGRSAEGKAKSK
jgi:hypothetical protein